MMRLPRAGAITGVAGALVLSSTATFAQAGAAADQSSAASTAQIETVVVTAERRPENLQNVPISITAFSAQDIKDRGASSVRDLQFDVPNLAFTGSNDWTNPNVNVRGITSAQSNTGFESPLAVYVDGIYMDGTAGVDLDLDGVQGLEVLLGPQGTLFGRNVTAGAILLTIAKPTDEFGGQLYAEDGTYSRAKIAGMINVPLISGELDMRVDASHAGMDGYITNLHDDRKFGGYDSDSVRTQFRWTPTDSLTVDLGADYFHQDGSLAYGRVTDPAAPGYTASRNTVDIDGPDTLNRTLEGLTLNAEYKLPSGVTLTSLTGVRSTKGGYGADLDNSPFAFLTSDFTRADKEVTQEFRVTSDSTSSLRYVFGLYYINENLNSLEHVLVGPDYPLPPGSMEVVKTGIVTNAYAAFGQVDYDILPELTLSVGARETYEAKNLTYSQKGIAILGIPDFNPFGNSQTDSAFTPAGSVTYHLNEDVNLYAKISSGFKAGGFNASFPAASPVTPQLSFGPEHVVNYEVGLKAEFFDHRLRIDQSVYYEKYKDMQVQQIFQTFTQVTNAGAAQLTGTELNVTAIPIERMLLTAGVGYSDAIFLTYLNAGGPGVNYNGNSLPNAPRWTFNAAAQYSVPVFYGEVNGRVEYTYRDKVNADAGESPLFLVKSLSQLNARLAWDLEPNYELAVWGRNLTDQVTDVNPQFNALGAQLATYNIGRTIGVSLSAKY